jgi:hypothetical protein
MSRTATFCPIWEGNGGKVQNREWHILELVAVYEMHRISFPASPRAQFSLQKKISTEKKSSMLMGSALMCSVLKRAG